VRSVGTGDSEDVEEYSSLAELVTDIDVGDAENEESLSLAELIIYVDVG
jgi:hypothetical protein